MDRGFLYSIFYDVVVNSGMVKFPQELHVTEVIWCLRKAYYNYLLNANPLPNSWMIRGRLYHEGVFRVIKARAGYYGISIRGTDYPVEVPIDEEFKLVGHVDLLVEDARSEEDTKPYVIELKFPRNGTLNPRVEPRYVQQANCYVGMLKAMEEDVSDTFYVISVYIKDNKETRRPEIFVHEFNYEPSLYKATLDRAKLLVDYIKKEELPPQAETEWECRHCIYYQLGLCKPKLGLFKGDESGGNGGSQH